MGILDSFRAVFAGSTNGTDAAVADRPDAPDVPSSSGSEGLMARTDAGDYVPVKRAAGAAPVGGSVSTMLSAPSRPRKGAAEVLESYNTTPTLRSAIGGLASVIAGNRWKLYAGAPTQRGGPFSFVDDGIRDLSTPHRQRALRLAVREEEAKEIRRHPWLDLMDNPNEYMNGRVARALTVISYKLIGEAAWVLAGEVDGPPTSFFPVPGTWIRQRPVPSDPFWVITLPGGAVLEAPQHMVRSFVDPNPVNPYGRGSGVGMALSDEIDIDEHAAKMLVAFFANSALPAALISVKGATKPYLERMKREWNNALQGFRKAFSNHWTGGEIDVKRLDVAFREMQLAQLRVHQRDAIQQGTGRPPEKMGIVTNSNKASALAASIIDATDQQVPMLEVLRTEMQAIASMFDPRLFAEYENPIPADVEAQRAMMATNPYAFRVDDVRAAADLEPIGDAEGGTGVVVNGQWFASPRDVAPPAQPASFGLQAQAPDLAASATDRAAEWLEQRASVRLIVAAVSIEDMADEVVPVATDVIDHYGQEALDSFGAGETFDSEAPRVKRALAAIRKKRVGTMINATTRAQLSDALRDAGVRAVTLADVVAAVTDVFSRAKADRSPVIASTETVTTSEWATVEAMRQTGVEVRKEWIATPDSLTRDSHAALDGQLQMPTDPFRIPAGELDAGATADAPGGFGIGAQDINCRCAVGTAFPEPTDEQKAASADREALWRRADEARTTWEEKMLAAVQRGFAAQEKTVLELVAQLYK